MKHALALLLAIPLYGSTIGFEDLPASTSDRDYNDLVVSISGVTIASSGMFHFQGPATGETPFQDGAYVDYILSDGFAITVALQGGQSAHWNTLVLFVHSMAYLLPPSDWLTVPAAPGDRVELWMQDHTAFQFWSSDGLQWDGMKHAVVATETVPVGPTETPEAGSFWMLLGGVGLVAAGRGISR